jgi:quercetin dioxygenase-like cupin family protein
MSGKARPTVQIDNDRVRVSEWRFGPGETTGWHRHAWDYVVVPIVSGRFRAVSAKGETVLEMVAGHAYFNRAGVEHEVVVNANAHEFVFVEVEVRAR